MNGRCICSLEASWQFCFQWPACLSKIHLSKSSLCPQLTSPELCLILNPYVPGNSDFILFLFGEECPGPLGPLFHLWGIGIKKERNGIKTLCANPAVAPHGSQITSGRGMSMAADVLQGCRGPRTAAGPTRTAPPLPPHSVPPTLARGALATGLLPGVLFTEIAAWLPPSFSSGSCSTLPY